MPKAKKVTTKDKFIAAGTELFRIHGYSGTGLKQVVAHAGAPWGSMYHFFPEGKEQLAETVVLSAGEKDNDDFELAFAKNNSAANVVKAIFNTEAKRLKASNFTSGCTVASVAADVVSASPRVLKACSDVFKQWQQTLSKGFIECGLPAAKANKFSAYVVTALEGATLLCRTHQTTEPLKTASAMLLEQLEHYADA